MGSAVQSGCHPTFTFPKFCGYICNFVTFVKSWQGGLARKNWTSCFNSSSTNTDPYINPHNEMTEHLYLSRIFGFMWWAVPPPRSLTSALPHIRKASLFLKGEKISLYSPIYCPGRKSFFSRECPRNVPPGPNLYLLLIILPHSMFQYRHWDFFHWPNF